MHYKQLLRYHLGASFKTLGTFCAAVPALIAAIRLDPRCWICFAALLIHSIADYLLEFNLYLGAGLFVAGHICYIGFFSRLVPVSGIHLITSLCMLGLVAVFLVRWRKSIGKQMPFFVVYGLALSIMCAFALSCLSAHTLQGILIAAGGALFFVSDAMLLGRLLFSATRPVDWAIMITYYAAQLLFGISCLIN